MREKNRFAFSASCSFSEKLVAGFARCGFNRHLFLLRDLANVYRAQLEIDMRIDHCRASAPLARPPTWQMQCLPYKSLVMQLDQLLNKARIGIARAATQLVI